MRTLVYCCLIAIPVFLLLSWMDDQQKLKDETHTAEVAAIQHNSPMSYREIQAQVRQRHADESLWGWLSIATN